MGQRGELDRGRVQGCDPRCRRDGNRHRRHDHGSLGHGRSLDAFGADNGFDLEHQAAFFAQDDVRDHGGRGGRRIAQGGVGDGVEGLFEAAVDKGRTRHGGVRREAIFEGEREGRLGLEDGGRRDGLRREGGGAVIAAVARDAEACMQKRERRRGRGGKCGLDRKGVARGGAGVARRGQHGIGCDAQCELHGLAKLRPLDAQFMQQIELLRGIEARSLNLRKNGVDAPERGAQWIQRFAGFRGVKGGGCGGGEAVEICEELRKTLAQRDGGVGCECGDAGERRVDAVERGLFGGRVPTHAKIGMNGTRSRRADTAGHQGVAGVEGAGGGQAGVAAADLRFLQGETFAGELDVGVAVHAEERGRFAFMDDDRGGRRVGDVLAGDVVVEARRGVLAGGVVEHALRRSMRAKGTRA